MSDDDGFARLRARLAALDLSPIDDVGRGVWIYGAGGFGRSVARALRRAGRPVLGFIDRKAGDAARVDGLACRRPESLALADVDGAFYVHGLLNHYFPTRDIAEWAAGRGFAGLLFPPDLYRIAGVDLRNYWLAPPRETLDHLDAIGRLHDALDDAESRTLLADLLVYRLSGDPRLHPEVNHDSMYAPDFLPIRGRPLTFVDGGAYNGDTLEALLSQGVDIADWIAFEPDARNLAALRATAARLAGRLGAFSLLPFGLADRNGTVGFVEGEGEASHLVETPGPDFAGATIPIVRLDDAIQRPAGAIYVKLDIEGAEPEALAGMARLLAQKPILAVSVYHKPSHLWDIPLALKAAHGATRLRLRQHSHHAFDTVVYAWPD